MWLNMSSLISKLSRS